MSRYYEKIIELRKLGKTYKEICNELNCAMSTVSYHCKLNKMGGSSDKLSEDKKMKLQVLYDEIGSVKKLSKTTGHSVGTILKYVKTKKRNKKLSSSESVILWRKRVKQKLIDYKGGHCEMCGYDKCNRALQFHHKNPEEKDFQISGKSLSFEKLKSEVDKCILVCSNCHCEIHDGLIETNKVL
jgi:hypothetical protein